VNLDKFGKTESKVGLEPGTLVHIGEKSVEKVRIKVVSYNSETIVEKELNSVEECMAFKDQPGTNLWINVDGLDSVEVIGKLGSYFNIHPFILEDDMGYR
jgi:magnesium transporter